MAIAKSTASEEAVEQPNEEVATADTQPLEQPIEEETPTNVSVPSRETVGVFKPPPERDPAEWSEPGWEQGLFPGDRNSYPDPEKPERSY